MLNFRISKAKKMILVIIPVAVIGSIAGWNVHSQVDRNITVEDFKTLKTVRTSEQIKKGNKELGLDKISEQGVCKGQYEIKLKDGSIFCTHGTD